MRIFGSDRIKSVMERLKIPEDMPIENRIISKSLESAPKKVEGNNFDTRKHLVEYDDVINKQRKAIYERRKQYLAIENMEDAHAQYRPLILEMVQSEIESVVLFHTASEVEKDWDLKEVAQVAETIFQFEESDRKTLEDMRKQGGDAEHDAAARGHIIEYLMSLANKAYDNMEKAIPDQKLLVTIEKGMLLRSIDQYWVAHLDNMQHLRAGIGLRGYGQKDPLVEYKKEAFGLYNHLNEDIRHQVVYSIFKVHAAIQLAPSLMEANQVLQGAAKTSGDLDLLKRANQGLNAIAVSNRNEYQGQKVGRNDDCPCGSGKKFKKCHGA
jgi:preprotein translocase subunit SecA